MLLFYWIPAYAGMTPKEEYLLVFVGKINKVYRRTFEMTSSDDEVISLRDTLEDCFIRAKTPSSQ